MTIRTSLSLLFALTLGACCCPQTPPDDGRGSEALRPEESECRRTPTRTDCTPIGMGGGPRIRVPVSTGETAIAGLYRDGDAVFLEVETERWLALSADGATEQALPAGTYAVELDFDAALIRLLRDDGLLITESVQVWPRDGDTLGLWAATFDDAGLLEIARGSLGASLTVGLRPVEDGANG